MLAKIRTIFGENMHFFGENMLCFPTTQAFTSKKGRAHPHTFIWIAQPSHFSSHSSKKGPNVHLQLFPYNHEGLQSLGNCDLCPHFYSGAV
jgi:hypothetical protein